MKKKITAIIAAILVVLLSTGFTVKLKLDKSSQAVTDGFYDGIVYDGYEHKSIYRQIMNISSAADGMVSIAAKYNIDTTAVTQANQNMKSSLSSFNNDIASIFTLYSSLTKSMSDMSLQLAGVELEERDASGISQYESTVSSAQNMIDTAGYNESVRDYLSENNQFPAAIFISLLGVDMPDYFA